MRLWIGICAVTVLGWGQEITLSPVASGISSPTDVQNAADGSGRLFLVEQAGRIKILKNGSVLPTLFLNISNKTVGGGERGLLGLAFPPGFQTSQRFYVNYTNLSGNTVIAMYRVTANQDVADAASETILLTIPQPFANHNGGQIRFGPDGFLYIGMGDGGSAGDPQGNGRRRDTLLAKMLRVDVDSDPGRVRVPLTNPFVSTSGARPEIWATGLRNPWRFSFDRQTGDLWIADVGQNIWEEVNFQSASSKGGEDYGWNNMEGAHCFSQANCSRDGLTLPVAEYAHGDSCSITGGFVYRGRLSPALRGWYIYGDYCSGRIWGYRDGVVKVLREARFNITTFGEDEQGEIYVANASNGTIQRIDGGRTPQVVNAASFEPGGLVAGTLATIFTSGIISDAGIVKADRIPLPLSLGGVTLSVNGVAAPILATANVDGFEQVNFQVPFGLGATSATVDVRRGANATTLTVPLVSASPGIYVGQDGRAIVVRGNYTLVTVSTPLVAGETVFLYAAGLPAPPNPPATGAAASETFPATTSAEVLLGGVACPVTFAGLASGFVGLYQVNFRVPEGLAGGIQELRIRASGQLSAPAAVPVR